MKRYWRVLWVFVIILISMQLESCESTGVTASSTVSVTPSITSPTPVITLEQAIAIAYANVPASASASVPMVVSWTPAIGSDGAWQMEFDDTQATQTDLGWADNHQDVLVDGSGPYKIILLDIEGKTGAVILKMASTSGVRTMQLPPPFTTVPPRVRPT